MAKLLQIAPKYAKLIVEDTVAKTGKMYIKYGYLHNSEGLPAVEEIVDLNNEISLPTTVTVIGTEKIAINMQDSLAEEIQYDRVYLCNKDNDILYVIDIQDEQKQEINEDFIINLDDSGVIVN